MIDACVVDTVPGGFSEVNKFAKESCLETAGGGGGGAWVGCGFGLGSLGEWF